MENIITKLMQYAYDHGITCVLSSDLSNYTPSSSRPDNRIVLINMNWHDQKEIPFQFAHELGHVMNEDEGILYYSSFSNKSKYERGANMTALDILIPIYLSATGYTVDNVFPFMKQFSIPASLSDDVIARFKKCIIKN
ncbi:ImmA/IrrE family metallo-endopeptidase [Levilactobacillus sp. HBUAS70063]|uniref:ImmA/IrrE family metallo-endopeptidase n=1 Tax=Levilactobacillus sp. HBUAS70063 TaxID=3109359 RepID=UPI003133457B